MEYKKFILTAFFIFVSLLFLSPIIASAEVIIKGEDIEVSQGIIGTKPKIVDATFVPTGYDQYFFDSDGTQKEFSVGYIKVVIQNNGDGTCPSTTGCPITVTINGSEFSYKNPDKSPPTTVFYIYPTYVQLLIFDVKVTALNTQSGEIITESPTITATSDSNGRLYKDTKILNDVRFKVPEKLTAKAPGFQVLSVLGIILFAFYFSRHK